MQTTLTPRIVARPLAALALAAATTGCALHRSTSDGFPEAVAVRAAADAPPRFEHTVTGTGCRSPMVDPSDDTSVRFVRSSRTHAEHEVPPGRYGVGRDEVLRIVCETGAVVGIVRR